EDEAEILQREQKELEAEWAGEPPPSPPTQISHAQAERYVAFGAFEEPDFVPPPYPSPGGATASNVRSYQIYRSKCGHSCDWWKAIVDNATYIRHYASVEWEHGTQVHAHMTQDWKFEAVILTTTWNCGAVGPMWVKKGSG